MNSELILAFDCETGGIDPKITSLLTAYFAVLDENFNCIDALELFIKPNYDEVFRVKAGALKINKIDLVELDKNGVTRGEAALKLSDFLTKHSNFGNSKLTPLVHNHPFDKDFLIEQLIPKDQWDKSVSYRVQDTSVIGNYLKRKGIIPKVVNGSLEGLCKFFSIDFNKDEAHSAKYDAVKMVLLYEKMLKV